MKRRQLIGSLLALPAVGVQAQQPLPTIGWLHPGQLPGSAKRYEGFLHGLSSQGFVPGNNVAIEYRWREATTSDCRRLRLNEAIE